MAGLFGWSSTQFDKLLEKATSHLLLEPDWDAILQICDCIRQGDVQPKYAISCIKKKLYTQNPHVVLYTLQVLESIVKNCGAPVHVEVASRPFMEELRDLVKATTNENVKNRILELVQAWAHAFRNQPKYRSVQDIFNLLRMEGYKLQVLKESDAMFSADTAPDWADGDCCHRCRVQFSVVQRKHHCRNCGQIFCQKCSAHNAPIPRFGIEKEVRVCDACWENLSNSVSIRENQVDDHPYFLPVTKQPGSAESSPKHAGKVSYHVHTNPATNPSAPGGKSEQELEEEEELQLALALSQSEAESKEKEHKPQMNKSPVHTTYSPPEEVKTVEPLKKGILAPTDSELDRYLNRSYWEQRQQQRNDYDEDGEDVPTSVEKRSSPIPSAPVSAGLPPVNTNSNLKVDELFQNGDDEDSEVPDFLVNLKATLEIFVNRMNSNSSRGRPIADDPYVQSLFMRITDMHSQLLKYIQREEDSRAYYEGLQDKLSQIRDKRAALDALRQEHQAKLRREAEEAERQRRIQMAHKLDIMRKQKQDYLEYQRQLAIQRMQEQEREMQMRQEQQKQQYNVAAMIPGAVLPASQQQPYVPPPGSQGYVNVQAPSGNVVMAAPQQQQHPYPAHQYRPPPVTAGAVPAPHMPSGEFQQSFNMQAPQQSVQFQHPRPQQQPDHTTVTSAGAAVTTAQNQGVIMHPGMVNHIPAHMLPPAPPINQQAPPSMSQRHQQQQPPPQVQHQQHGAVPVTSTIPNNIPQHITTPAMPHHVVPQTAPQHVVASTVQVAPIQHQPQVPQPVGMQQQQHHHQHQPTVVSLVQQVQQPISHPAVTQQQHPKEKEEDSAPLIVFD